MEKVTPHMARLRHWKEEIASTIAHVSTLPWYHTEHVSSNKGHTRTSVHREHVRCANQTPPFNMFIVRTYPSLRRP